MLSNSNSEEKEISIENPINELHESEITTQRITKKENEEIEPTKDSDVLKEKKKVPLLISFLSIFHLLLVSLLFYCSLHFYNKYIDCKDDEEWTVDSLTEISKAIGCLIGGFFFAYCRAILLERFY